MNTPDNEPEFLSLEFTTPFDLIVNIGPDQSTIELVPQPLQSLFRDIQQQNQHNN